MKSFKIKVPTQAISKLVQERIFELGYRWGGVDKTAIHTDSKNLFIWTDGVIFYSNIDDTFSTSDREELQIADLWDEEIFKLKKKEIEKLHVGGVALPQGYTQEQVFAMKINELIDTVNKLKEVK